MTEAMVKDPMIGQALDLEKLFLQNQMERYNYLLSYKAMRDAETNDETIRRAALAKGRAEGEAKGRVETARNLLRMGLEYIQIAVPHEIPRVGSVRPAAGKRSPHRVLIHEDTPLTLVLMMDKW